MIIIRSINMDIELDLYERKFLRLCFTLLDEYLFNILSYG
jgi:hypothetical protein